MKHLNFLSKSGSGSRSHGIVTSCTTVGSPSVHRRGTMLKLLSVLVLIFTFGIGQMWGATYVKVTSASDLVAGQVYVIAEISENTKYLVTGTGSKLANTTSGFTVSNNTITTSTATPLEFTLGTVTSGNNTYYTLKCSSTEYLGYNSSTNFRTNQTTTTDTKEQWSITPSSSAYKILNVSSNTRYIGRNGTSIGPYSTSNSYPNCYLFKKQASCTNSVTITTGTPTNATITASATSITTCSSTAADRQVTVSVAPANCYAAPVAASVTKTGNAAASATLKSGPTWNSTTQKYDYVFEYTQNATGSTTFNVSLSAKTTYTVNFNKGNATGATGDASSDTKTCGEALTLPNTALFTRTGYTQQGWSIAQTGTTKNYNLGGSYTTDAATTLYPYWQANSYSVTWMVNNAAYTTGGGSTSVNHDSHITTVSSAPNPLPCGDKFVGWTTDAEYVHNSSPLYKTANDFPNATTDQVFYAVFADYDE